MSPDQRKRAEQERHEEIARAGRMPIMLYGLASTSVPWDFVATRRRCLMNHFQTPERLAERGGLSPMEALTILQDREWNGRTYWLPEQRDALVAAEAAALSELRALAAQKAEGDRATRRTER